MLTVEAFRTEIWRRGWLDPNDNIDDMNPREAKVADRLRELIKEGEALKSKQITKTTSGRVTSQSFSFIPDVGGLREWIVKGSSILQAAFDIHYGHFVALGTNPQNS